MSLEERKRLPNSKTTCAFSLMEMRTSSSSPRERNSSDTVRAGNTTSRALSGANSTSLQNSAKRRLSVATAVTLPSANDRSTPVRIGRWSSVAAA